MIRIRNTTLISVSGLHPDQALKALETSCAQCRFDHVRLLTDQPLVHRRIDIQRIESLHNTEAYSRFVLKRLFDYVLTDYCLIIQPDGFVRNEKAWTDEYFNYDYIGAPWDLQFNFPCLTSRNRVGNGGFSLRSRRLLYATKYLYKHQDFHPEDVVICRLHREFFESLGIKFAPVEVAEKFSVENNLYSGQFGFHGALTMEANKITL